MLSCMCSLMSARTRPDTHTQITLKQWTEHQLPYHYVKRKVQYNICHYALVFPVSHLKTFKTTTKFGNKWRPTICGAMSPHILHTLVHRLELLFYLLAVSPCNCWPIFQVQYPEAECFSFQSHRDSSRYALTLGGAYIVLPYDPVLVSVSWPAKP